MEKLQETFKNPLYAGVAGFVLGLIIGWFVIGWGLWPVEWTDAAPSDLRPDARIEYMRMAVDAFDRTKDITAAKYRWNEMGEYAEEALAGVQDRPQDMINNFKIAVGATIEATTPETTEEKPAGNNLLLIGLCLVVLIVAAAVGGFFYTRRSREPREESVAAQAARVSQAMAKTDYESMGENPPLGQFMTTYMLGDDLFDDSFSVDGASGDFLGECGVGIAETIGVGDPKKVSAFEVWLFDKNDIQTITRVLMSKHAYHDAATRERLAAKGEPVLAEPGTSFVLETATLQLVARIIDMEYGESALPDSSFFSRLTLELAVWNKPE